MKYRAIILAAGIGSRLRPLTDLVPKCMVKVNGEYIIDRQIEALIRAGVTDILVCSGYKSDVLKQHLEKSYPSIKILEIPEYESTNNMYSMFRTKDFSYDHDIIVMNADVFVSYDYVKKLILSPIPNAILTERGRFEEENMKIVCNHGTISQISKQIEQKNAFGTTIDLYKFSKEFTKKWFEIMNEYINVKCEKKLWNEVGINDMFRFFNVKPITIGKYWFEIDNIEDLRNANALFLEESNTKSNK